MQIQTGATVDVLLGDLTIGTLLVEGLHEGGATLAKFTPGDGYASVMTVFEEFEDAVGDVSLHVAEEIAKRIDALTPSLHFPGAGAKERIYDLQIFRNGGASFRTEEGRLW